MKNKGFTLIELLAVIVILAIIALIATPIILNIIDETKEQSVKRSIDHYMSAVTTAIARANLNNVSNGVNPSECTTTEEGLSCAGTPIPVEVDGDKPKTGGTITFENGKITYINITMPDGNTYGFDDKGNIVKTGEGSVPGTENSKPDLGDVCKYTTDEKDNEMVTCGSEGFFIIDYTETEVTMLSAYNLKLSTTNPGQDSTDTDVTSTNAIKFAESTYWSSGEYSTEESTGYKYVYDNNANAWEYIEAYKSKLEAMGVNVIEAKLMSYVQASKKLKCSFQDCTSAPSWVYSSTYWLGTATGIHSPAYVTTRGSISTNADLDGCGGVCGTNVPGVRPVITISTSNAQ